MNSEMQRQIAWITGASSGLGRELALLMAQEGWNVAISARRTEELAAVAAEARSYLGRILPVPLDTTDAASVKAGVERIEKEFGPIDLAVFNAGTHHPMLAEEITAEAAGALIDVNLKGTANCLAAVLPFFLERKAGHLAFVASMSSYRGLPTAALYGATKAGIVNMAEALQPDLKRSGIKVQVVNPGFVKTPLTDKNDFPMPFLMEADEAARAFYKGLQSRKFEIMFPKTFGRIMKVLRLLPASLALKLTARAIPKEKPGAGKSAATTKNKSAQETRLTA
ncbi:SDR family NAD(P)-dependent oxidoreductase [Tepidicaulis sp.]|uniref:SDR family NAD(P)-dependent oxidoreductase n=1 Tax=Tepidicaulis sp. TaxID=1920809 RepID=UPI003B58C080